MAEPLFNPDDYSTFIPPPSGTMGQIYGNVAKKNRNSSDPIGYVFDNFQYDVDEYNVRNPYIDRGSWIQQNASELYTDYERARTGIDGDGNPTTDPAAIVSWSDGAFEKSIADFILDPKFRKDAGIDAKGTLSPATIDIYVGRLIDSGIYTGDVTDRVAPLNYGKNRYQEFKNAQNDWINYETERQALSPTGRLGLPDPAENYNPLKFDNYVKWETNKIAALKKQFGTQLTPSIQKKVESIYRLRAVERNRTDGRTPFKDALMLYEARR